MSWITRYNCVCTDQSPKRCRKLSATGARNSACDVCTSVANYLVRAGNLYTPPCYSVTETQRFVRERDKPSPTGTSQFIQKKQTSRQFILSPVLRYAESASHTASPSLVTEQVHGFISSSQPLPGSKFHSSHTIRFIPLERRSDVVLHICFIFGKSLVRISAVGDWLPFITIS
jgi:hypothetical protein